MVTFSIFGKNFRDCPFQMSLQCEILEIRFDTLLVGQYAFIFILPSIIAKFVETGKSAYNDQLG
jgi:hypothetical protein